MSSNEPAVPSALWTDFAARAGRSLSANQLSALSRYLELLTAANERMNLTRIIDRPTAEVQHVGDALTLLPFLPPAGQAFSLADVGSGGGVPGVPLAIAVPEARVTLIEATKKKANFLRETVATLGLKNVAVVDVRAEAAGQTADLRERFDVVVARAVATMPWLAEWCLPLVRRGGMVLCMKGPKAAEELPAAAKAIKLCGGTEPITHPVELPGTEHRVIIELRKVNKCDLRYPRPATSAKGNPVA